MVKKSTERSKHFTILVLVVLALTVLAGCSIQQAGVSTDEHAAENRQYMALLNQKTGELDEVLTQFQTAVSASDTVSMKAAVASANKIVEDIESSEATESLAEVKDAYVAGLGQLNASMNDYADLYTDVASGKLNEAAITRQTKAIQADYDQALEKLVAADELLTKLANE